MKKFSFVVCFLISATALSQNWQWAKNVSYSFSPNSYSYLPVGIHIAKGDLGDFFLSTNSSTAGACLSRIDGTGTEVWRTYMNGNIAINGIAYGTKKVYITGTFENTVIIGNDTLISNGSQDAIVACFTSNGSPVWIKQFGGSGQDQCNGICKDKKNNIYITGQYADTVNFDATTLICQGTNNMFMAKLDQYGNILLLKSAGSIYNKRGSCGSKIKTDSLGNIIILGDYGDIVLDTCHLTGYGPYGDQYLCKLDSNGYTQWAKQPTTFTDKFHDLAIDDSCNIFGAGGGGWTSGSWSITRKHDSFGQQTWNRGLYQWHDLYSAIAIATDGSNSFIVGCAQLHYHPDWTSYNFFLLAKYDGNGNLEYNDTIKVAALDNTNVKYANGMDIIRDDNGDYIIAGTMKGNLNLGSHFVSSSTDQVFIAKFSDKKIVTDIVAKKHKDNSNIYPNPSTGKITVSLAEKILRAQICIHDVLGNCIFSKYYNNENDIVLDLGNHAKGIYFVEVISGESKTMKKIILQ